jgi:hypothetical protein
METSVSFPCHAFRSPPARGFAGLGHPGVDRFLGARLTNPGVPSKYRVTIFEIDAPFPSLF